MTDKLNTQVVIPVWLITLASSLFLTWMIFSISQVKAQQIINTKVEILEETQKLKANKAEVDRIYTILDRMDTKLDKLMQE